MEERDITMADMIMKIIQGNQLTAGEEDAVGELLLRRQAERDESRDYRCLAEYVDAAIKRTLRRQGKEAWEKYSYFNKRYVKESRVGNLDTAGLTAADIRRLVVLTAGTYRMGSEDRLFFLSMLQYALNLMEKKDASNFAVPELYRECARAEGRITFIENPYTEEETKRIMEWINRNKYDMIGLAVGLWLAMDISPEEIVGLRKECLMDADGVCIDKPIVLKKNEAEDYIALAGIRGGIIQAALKLHGDMDLEYIFMSDSGGSWKKMLGRCLPQKMSFICKDLGIIYQPFKSTDAIRWHA